MASADPSVRAGAQLPASTVLVGRSPALRRLAMRLDQVGESIEPVLLRGEPGTGKGLVGQLLHERWGGGEMVRIASRRGVGFDGDGGGNGALERVGAGATVIVDDLGDAPAALQAALRRLLERSRRVIGITRRDLEGAVRRTSLSPELLAGFEATVWLPPMRARREDVSELVLHFSALECAALARPGVIVTPSAMDLLSDQRWPGNIRQIRDVVARLVAGVGPGGTIGTTEVAREITRASHEASAPIGSSSWAQPGAAP